MGTIKEALTFDDILMLPRYSNVLPADTNIKLNLTKNIQLKVPFLSAAIAGDVVKAIADTRTARLVPVLNSVLDLII